MPGRPLRTTLTAWNVAVLVAILFLAGTALLVTNRSRLSAEIDRDLRDRAERETHRPRRPDDGGPFFGGPGDGPPEGGPDQQPRRRPPGFDDIHRPRSFDATGKGEGPSTGQTAWAPAEVAKVLAGGGERFADITADGRSIRVFTLAKREGERIEGAVQTARDTSDLDVLFAVQAGTMLLILPFAVAIAAAGGFALTNRALRPIASLTQAAANIQSTDLSKRLEVTGDDEMAELARTFNGMVARLEQSFGDLNAAYRSLEASYERQRQFTADASHELRTPLTRMRLAATSALSHDAPPEELRRALATVDQGTESMSRLVLQLLTLAQADAGKLALVRERVDLRALVADALPESDRIAAQFDDAPVMVDADPAHLPRVVINLVENALRHSGPDGVVEVTVSRRAAEAMVTVRDHGEGIAAEHLPHLFDRFYRVDAARSQREGGTGLGLAICKNVVEAHGGRITLASQLGAGTTVEIFLPLF